MMNKSFKWLQAPSFISILPLLHPPPTLNRFCARSRFNNNNNIDDTRTRKLLVRYKHSRQIKIYTTTMKHHRIIWSRRLNILFFPLFITFTFASLRSFAFDFRFFFLLMFIAFFASHGHRTALIQIYERKIRRKRTSRAIWDYFCQETEEEERKIFNKSTQQEKKGKKSLKISSIKNNTWDVSWRRKKW